MLHFLKGHGSENDFVVLPDPDGLLDLTPALVRALCDRRAGIGGDGVLRVVRTPKSGLPADCADGAEWFMDYHNADGSTAEMCGNGIRVYARYLVDAGLAEPGRLQLATRGGIKGVEVAATGDVSVDMGPARLLGTSTVLLGGRECEGVHVDVGNPHLVCVIDDDLASWNLSGPPVVDAATFPDGVNVELVAERGAGRVAMRVYERGVGETRSCGTGACAVAVAMSARGRHAGRSASRWTVEVPGGCLLVDLTGAGARLTGPAVIVASGVVEDAWLVQ